MPTKPIKRLLLLWLVLVAGFFLWESRGYRGLFAWTTEWQIALLGFYKPALTVLLLALVLALPLIVAMAITRRRRPRTETLGATDAPVLASRYLRLLNVCGLLFSIAAIGSVLYSFVLPGWSGAPRAVTVGAPAAQHPQGPARLVGAAPERRRAVFIQDYLFGTHETRFAAVRGAGGQVSYFVELDPIERERGLAAVPARYRDGILVRNGLPGAIRRLYRELNYPVATPHYVLYRTPTAYRLPYYIAAVEFALLALLCWLVGLFQGRRVHRLREAGTLPATI